DLQTKIDNKSKKLSTTLSTPNPIRQHKHQTTKKEKEILEPILLYKKFSANKLDDILLQLQIESIEWTETR
ncbi:11225_t:CDS:1, partial [Ambispora leptoticha]